jgi:hypothetical protein
LVGDHLPEGFVPAQVREELEDLGLHAIDLLEHLVDLPFQVLGLEVHTSV